MQTGCVEIHAILKNLHFPLTKKDMIQQSLKHGASNNIMRVLRSIPDREYISYDNVIKELVIIRTYDAKSSKVSFIIKI